MTTNRSAGFRSRVLSEPPPLKYWATLAAIRRIMRDASDPATVLDALFDPGPPSNTTVSGVRSTGRPVGRPRKPSLAQLQADLDELERTDPAVKAAAERYDRAVEAILDRPSR